MGAETIAFEQEQAAAVEAPEVVTVSSCTAALSLCLQVLGIGAGDEVVYPSRFTHAQSVLLSAERTELRLVNPRAPRA